MTTSRRLTQAYKRLKTELNSITQILKSLKRSENYSIDKLRVCKNNSKKIHTENYSTLSIYEDSTITEGYRDKTHDISKLLTLT